MKSVKLYYFFLPLAFLILALNFFVFPKADFKEKTDALRFHTPPKYLKYMTFGFDDLIADMMWLRFIQDLDHCVRLTSEQTAECKKGWGYYMILSVHDIAPKFRIPMAVGPMSLSVLQDDFEGAEELFVKATEAFPTDWPILYRAAFHFIHEGNDPKRAADYLARAAEHGAPEWARSLASRLYEKEGQKELALRTLYEYRKTLEHPDAVKKVDDRIKAIESSL